MKKSKTHVTEKHVTENTICDVTGYGEITYMKQALENRRGSPSLIKTITLNQASMRSTKGDKLKWNY